MQYTWAGNEVADQRTESRTIGGPCKVVFCLWRCAFKRGLQNHTHPSINNKTTLDHSPPLLTSTYVVRKTAQPVLADTACADYLDDHSGKDL